ncbi:MAG: hypothetical protein CMB31_06640 [Euryarchaeota archaeon]|nr:hypothetical protein [Euryarchaeota archaeon]
MAKKANSGSIGWGVMRHGRGLWSRNAVKGERVRDERLRRDGKIEWRSWNPRSSKLGAAIIRSSGDAEILLPEPGSTVLYIGAGHGTTISHLHDHVCGSGNHHGGSIVAVDLSARCIRDLLSLAEKRPGILPVLSDARNLDDYAIFLSNRVPWILQDVSQAGQVDLMLRICNRFLSSNGIALLSLKAASERWTDGGDEARFLAAESKIAESNLELVERIDLKGLEDQHVMYLLRSP